MIWDWMLEKVINNTFIIDTIVLLKYRQYVPVQSRLVFLLVAMFEPQCAPAECDTVTFINPNSFLVNVMETCEINTH